MHGSHPLAGEDRVRHAAEMIIARLSAALLLATSAPAHAALSPKDAKMVKAVDASTEADIALLERMVNINSGTRNIAGVTKMAELMTAELKPLGFTVTWKPLPETGRAGVLLAEHKGNGKGRRILLIGHMDTVFEKDSAFQTFVRKGPIAEGPGTNDMKGGLVVMLSALRAMQAAGTLSAADIRIVLSGDEESTGKPTSVARADMIAAGKWADAALEFETVAQEGGRDMGSISRRGSISWKIEAKGKTGHSSGVFSEGAGFGANYELARILDQFRRELREPSLTYNIGLIMGGATAEPTSDDAIAGTVTGKPNIIAARAIATGDIRALSNDQAERTEAKMKAIVDQHLPGTNATISFGEGYPGMPPTAGSRALLGVLNGLNTDLGLPNMEELDPLKRGAGDIAFVAPYVDGLVGTGAAGAGAHAPGETVELASIPKQAKRDALLMTRLSNMATVKGTVTRRGLK